MFKITMRASLSCLSPSNPDRRSSAHTPRRPASPLDNPPILFSGPGISRDVGQAANFYQPLMQPSVSNWLTAKSLSAEPGNSCLSIRSQRQCPQQRFAGRSGIVGAIGLKSAQFAQQAMFLIETINLSSVLSKSRAITRTAGNRRTNGTRARICRGQDLLRRWRARPHRSGRVRRFPQVRRAHAVPAIGGTRCHFSA
jgi:hypothetical protein